MTKRRTLKLYSYCYILGIIPKPDEKGQETPINNHPGSAGYGAILLLSLNSVRFNVMSAEETPADTDDACFKDQSQQSGLLTKNELDPLLVLNRL